MRDGLFMVINGESLNRDFAAAARRGSCSVIFGHFWFKASNGEMHPEGCEQIEKVTGGGLAIKGTLSSGTLSSI